MGMLVSRGGRIISGKAEMIVVPAFLAMPPRRMEGMDKTAQKKAAVYERSWACRDVLTDNTRWK